jgi:integrase/recombinase XerD
MENAATLDPVIVDYLDHLQFERGLSANTVAAYRRDLRDFAAFLRARGRGLLTCDERTAEDYFQSGGGASPASAARRMAAVRGLYRYLTAEGALAQDPAVRLRTPKRGRTLPKVLAVEEVERILTRVRATDAGGQRDLAMLELLYGCGLRASELITLREADLDLEGGLVRCLGKGGKERVVPMGGRAVEALRRYVADGRRSLLRGRRRDELFLNAHGRPLTRQGLDYIVRRHVRAAGLERAVGAHVFRHSFATHLVRAGADLRSVQEMLGHADVATTQVYTHVTAEHLREVFLASHPRARRRAPRKEGQ